VTSLRLLLILSAAVNPYAWLEANSGFMANAAGGTPQGRIAASISGEHVFARLLLRARH
jgi:hypothetical protein